MRLQNLKLSVLALCVASALGGAYSVSQLSTIGEARAAAPTAVTQPNPVLASAPVSGFPDLAGIVEEEYKESLKNFDAYEIQVLLSHPYDSNNAILELHPGAGGTEAMDWAEMLYRMYCRWAERRGFKVTVLDYQEGEEAGIKSCSILIMVGSW